MAFRQHGPVGIDTVKPPLKDSGRGTYPELWELDISTRSPMDRIHDGRERALLYVSRALGSEKCSASCPCLSEDRMRGGGVTLIIKFFILLGSAPRRSSIRRWGATKIADSVGEAYAGCGPTGSQPVG